MVRTVCFLALIVLSSATVFAQTCTTYVVVDPFDGKTRHGIDGLKAEDFEARSFGVASSACSERHSELQ